MDVLFNHMLKVYLCSKIGNHKNIVDVTQTSDKGMLGQEYIQKRIYNVHKELRQSTITSGSSICAIVLLHQKIRKDIHLSLRLIILPFLPSKTLAFLSLRITKPYLCSISDF